MSKVSTKSKVELENEEDDDGNESATRVNIDNTYYFRLDVRNYILCREKEGKNKEGGIIKSEVVIGFYSSLEGLFKRYFKEQVNIRIRNKTMDLLDFKKVITEVNSDIKKIADSLGFNIGNK